jgi:hypothetical protein
MFDRFADGKEVWIRAELVDENQQRRFDRLAGRMGVTNGQITREEFRHFVQKQQAERDSRNPMGLSPTSTDPFGRGASSSNVQLEQKLDRILIQLRRLERRLAEEKNRTATENPKQ